MNEQPSPQTPGGAWACVEQINDAWLKDRPDRLADLLQPGFVMALPGFAGRVEGAEAVIAGFEDFCRTCRVHAFEVRDRQVDVVDGTAVASFLFDLVYERGGTKYRSTGRDLWVLQGVGERWRAVWRTMLDLTDVPL